MTSLRTQLQSILEALDAQGFDCRDLAFEPAARESEVEGVEASLGFQLPAALRRFFLKVSRGVEFAWFAPEGESFPDPFGGIFCGDLTVSLDSIAELEESRRSWCEEVFPDSDSPYDSVWQQAIAFQPVGNGDLLAIDTRPERAGQVIYLSHDDGEGHGYAMATDFEDLIRRWVPLACAGAEDWQWLPFTNGRSSPIDPFSALAIEWRKILCLST